MVANRRAALGRHPFQRSAASRGRAGSRPRRHGTGRLSRRAGSSLPRGARNRRKSAARGGEGREINSRYAARPIAGIFSGVQRGIEHGAHARIRARAARRLPAARLREPFAPRLTISTRALQSSRKIRESARHHERASLRFGCSFGLHLCRHALRPEKIAPRSRHSRQRGACRGRRRFHDESGCRRTGCRCRASTCANRAAACAA